jgi:hypothetical protein
MNIYETSVKINIWFIKHMEHNIFKSYLKYQLNEFRKRLTRILGFS